jgi:glyoxylase I family protein
MILGIHHFSIIVSSEESVKFYGKLGFREERRIERGYDTVVLMSGYGIGLEIFIDPSHPARSTPEPLGLRNISLRVDDVDKTAMELGLDDVEINTDWSGNRYCLITDPDGNSVQLCE